MMIPSISILEIPAPGGALIYQAFSQYEGQLIQHEEYVSPDMMRAIPEGILGRQMRRHVAHVLLEKMMNEVIDRA